MISIFLLLSSVFDASAKEAEEVEKDETIDLTEPIFMKSGDDNAIHQLITDMNAGKVSALIINGVNPSYSFAKASEFNKALSKVDLKIIEALENPK